MKRLPMGRTPAKRTFHSVQRQYVMTGYLNALGPAPTESPDWVTAVLKESPGGWLMDGNDQYGDCVVADCAHQEMLRTANTGAIWTPNMLAVLGLYAHFQGYTGSMTSLLDIQEYLANNDNGCNELDVIQYLTKTGWLGRKLDAAANLDPKELDQIKWAVCIFGASRLGLNLPDSAQNQFEAGEPWTPIPNASLEGGHDVPVVKYDGTYFYVVTWGKLQPVTPAFLTAKYPDGTPYLEEAHAELAFDWVNAAGTCPAHLNLKQLVADLAAIVEPSPTPQPKPVPLPPSPPPSPTPMPMSKNELYYLISAAAYTDARNDNMSINHMVADLARILNEVNK